MSDSLSVDGSRNIHTTSSMHELIRLDKQSYFPAALQQVAVTLLKFKMVLLAKFYSILFDKHEDVWYLQQQQQKTTCSTRMIQLVAATDS